MSKPLDRRKFLGSAAALSLSAASYADVAGANERVRVGFLGCGGRAQAHIDLVNRLAAQGQAVAPVAVCDVWDGLEDEYEVEFGGKTTRRRYSQGLYPVRANAVSTRPTRRASRRTTGVVLDLKDVDAVCIATPDHWHGRMTVDALAAGKDVYVEKPMTRRAEEAVAVVDAWQRTGRVVTVGVQSMADPVWMRAFDLIRSGGIGHVAHAQTGAFRNDIRGQWRFYRLAHEMNPKTIDWDLFLGHQFELAGQPVGPSPREAKFDRAAFAQWRCVTDFSGGPITDLLAHPITHMIAAMGVRFPARVTAGGGLYLEYDGRSVPDVATVVADYEEGCQLVASTATISAYPMEEVIRGRLGAIKFIRGGFQSLPRRPDTRRDLPSATGRAAAAFRNGRGRAAEERDGGTLGELPRLRPHTSAIDFQPARSRRGRGRRDRDGRTKLRIRPSDDVLGPRPPRHRVAELWLGRALAGPEPLAANRIRSLAGPVATRAVRSSRLHIRNSPGRG